MPSDTKLSLQDLTEQEIQEFLGDSVPKFRSNQIYLASRQYKELKNINVPSDIKDKIASKYLDRSVTILEAYSGKEGVEKYLFLLSDNNIVEGVFMPHKYGNTLCISTQVGCRMGCKFCASTLNGLVRNLTAGEMLGEVLATNVRHGGTLKERKVTNIVLMGSGEPLDNYDNVVKFLNLVSEPNGIGISPRNISLSTCGLVDRIRDLADLGMPVVLTISLHASSDEIRENLMPINKKYKISEILSAAKYYFEKTGRRIIFEYSLIEGQNSSKKEATALAHLLHGLNAHVNLINLNPVKERKLSGTDSNTIKEFMETLAKLGISNTLRHSMGNDIKGACGQLRASYLDEKKN